MGCCPGKLASCKDIPSGVYPKMRGCRGPGLMGEVSCAISRRVKKSLTWVNSNVRAEILK